MSETIWDLIIIGAGPAGLMVGITVARYHKKVLILDSQDRPGKKLLITGGGRCNITSSRVTEKDYQSGALRTVRNIVSAFPFRAAEKFFSGNGIAFIEEEGKIFPANGSAKAVRDALLLAALAAGVRIDPLRRVVEIIRRKDSFLICGAGFAYQSRTVVLATGGLSYPETGSDGSGYALARSLGHTIVPPTPALTPLLLRDPSWNSLAGITLPVALSLVRNGKTIAGASGPLLFTHVGISGPSVLDLSRHWIRAGDKKETSFCVNFLPDQKQDDFLEGVTKSAESQPALSLKKVMARYFPERLAEVLLLKIGIDPKRQLAHCSKKDRQALVVAVFSMPVDIDGAAGYEKAEVTAGGVEMTEVDSKTLASKKCPGLFFAGEILDVDGRIGGFNLHWAWASGYAVGEAIAKEAAGDPPGIKR